MSKTNSRLASRYAKSLLLAVEEELGVDGKPTPAQKIAEELTGFIEVWNSHMELSEAVVNPMFPREERLLALEAVSKKVKLSKVAGRFVALVFTKDRISHIADIVASFCRVADAHAGVIQVEVTVVKKLDKSEQQSIESSLSQFIEGELDFSWIYDSSILGGMIVTYGSNKLDGSVKGRLEAVEQQLLRVS